MRGEVGLDAARDDLHVGTLRGDDEVDADRTGLLGQAHHGRLDLAGRHDQVGELIDHHHDVGQVVVSVLGIEAAGDELIVVLGDVARPGFLTQLQSVVHLHAE